jgi:hypothetical protein
MRDRGPSLLLLQRNNDERKEGITSSFEGRDLYCYPLRSGQDSCRRAVRIVVAEQTLERHRIAVLDGLAVDRLDVLVVCAHVQDEPSTITDCGKGAAQLHKRFGAIVCEGEVFGAKDGARWTNPSELSDEVGQRTQPRVNVRRAAQLGRDVVMSWSPRAAAGAGNTRPRSRAPPYCRRESAESPCCRS